MEIEKNIAFFIDQQFPDIYRQDGPELVQLVKDYYKFLENETNQTHYVSRRFFEYKDIDTTVKEMLIFFQKKFLADLPLKQDIVPFLVKNILDLYRRKGTPAGIELFFSIFFNEYDVEIFYPAEKMLKVSNSKWRRGVYLQLFPNNNYFVSRSGKEYTYADLISRNIEGSISEAKAAVSRINFILLDGTRTPIIYIDSVQGAFEKFDDITANINGEEVVFGRLNGSLNAFEIDQEYVNATVGNEVGDILNVSSGAGTGGKVVVTATSDDISGTIRYDFQNGGYGYTVENTRLLVSDQSIIYDNVNEDFVIYERLRDSAGNEGIVIGQSRSIIGVKMNAGQSFSFSRAISTVDRVDENGDPDNFVLDVQGVSAKNGSSPGTLFPDNGDADTDVIVSSLSDTSDIDVITDVIQPFIGVSLDAADYETAGAMSGTASPVTINTPLNQAFEVQTLTIGKIEAFANIDPGSGYETDVFTRALDDVMSAFEIKNQVVRLEEPGNAGLFNIGEIITQRISSIDAEIKAIDTQKGLIYITPFDYYGFNSTDDVVRSNGDRYSISGVERDYTSNSFGDNAVIDSTTVFSEGKISEVAILNSGFSYLTSDRAAGELRNGILVDDEGIPQAAGWITADTQGFTEGYWADYSSHLNGFIKLPYSQQTTPILPTSAFALQVLRVAVGLSTEPEILETWLTTTASDGFEYGDINKDGRINSGDAIAFIKLAVGATDLTQGEIDRWNNIVAPSLKEQFWYNLNAELWQAVTEYSYYEAGQRIQDSDFYQEYSYQIKSSLDKSLYEASLKENVHLAGSKMFGDFVYKVSVPAKMKSRFIRFFNDDGRGSALDLANVAIIEASVTNYTADSTFVTADHEPI